VLNFILLASALFVFAHASRPAHAASSFSFTALGDYAETNYTTANLNYIAQSGVSFHLGLGDFNYDHAHITADQWSDYIKKHLPANFPFEIVAGNEDKSQIKTYATELPDRLGTISGTYAKEYSFDYPPGTPLARFILVSPGGIVPGYDYSVGSPHYSWVAQQIDAARSLGIPWVIVGMHEYCLVIDSTHPDPCSSLDLFNLLISKKVDLILYGHKHNFQVSKQLALNGTTCTSFTLGTYNRNCVVSSSTSLTKGGGSVIVINGTGGESVSPINLSDPHKNYFRTWEGRNVNATMGVSLVTVSDHRLTVKFVGTSGGTFSDSFTIA
jgi:predicted phosphodiesterase